ncbi:glycosyl transferase [Geothermobacter hydrogeniphilus]|uniref:Glycosyl transferase n=1 Tax=Geothermobacter hydrogeniphilus TaxID=1969733 RepID=A0A2K2H9H9_9BACT|nr:TIGR03013 family XrtA/PEP-CTERM system glycosyltransferase [Geothermobacter hydrogeniphilus]PNU19956.1 glycosyl transferase [Geothermobacter hydrogeniphilus]
MKKPNLILAGGDFLLAALIPALVGMFLAMLSGRSMPTSFSHGLGQSLVFGLTVVFSTYFAELYRGDRRFRWKETCVRILIAGLMAFLILLLFYAVTPQSQWLPGQLVLVLAGVGLAQLLWHYRYPILLRFPWISQNVMVLGTGARAREVAGLIDSEQNPFVFKGYIHPENVVDESTEESVCCKMEKLKELIRRNQVKKLVLALTERRGVLPVGDILWCKLHGVEVIDSVTFYEKVTGKLKLEDITPSWFIFSDGFCVTRYVLWQKRVFSILLSGVGILLALPIFPLVALLIKLESPGPVFFCQERVGFGGRVFRTYKFRTMRQDAEQETGAVWAQSNDPRITRVGRFLRKSRIDEIPQLFNVFKGDMSFVGPRPERPEFVAMLTRKIPYYGSRHAVKPGLTGWAQVRYPYGASVEDALEKLRYDLYYIKNYSPFLDIVIVLETVKVVLFARGSR